MEASSAFQGLSVVGEMSAALGNDGLEGFEVGSHPMLNGGWHPYRRHLM